MRNNKSTFDRGFRTLFEDSVRLLLASEKNLFKDDSQYSFARASIVSSMMIPEVCSNICIESLKLENSIFNDIDKLSPIGKFDFFLRVNFKDKKINKGVKVVQALQELKKLRDKFVHPKKTKVFWSKSQEDEDTFDGISEKTPILQISVNPDLWYQDDAIKAMNGVHSFMAYFFKELCRFSQKKVTSMLFAEDEEIPDSDPLVFYYDKEFHRNLKRWKINTSYFRIGRL